MMFTVFGRLTGMFGELLEKFLPIPVLGYVTHKQAMVIERDSYTDFFAFPKLKIVQLKHIQ